MLILLRHGESVLNRGAKLLGSSDPHLTDLGRQQAAKASEKLKSIRNVISSPLTRALETAEIVSPNQQIKVDTRWREINYGQYEGLNLEDLSEEVRAKWKSDPGFCPPGGESLISVSQRVSCALEDLRNQACESDVLVVSHVSPIKAAVALALGVDMSIAWKMRLSLCSLTTITVDEDNMVLTGFNEVPYSR